MSCGNGQLHKDILVGCGGKDTINHSHILGAVFGMERIMGRIILLSERF